MALTLTLAQFINARDGRLAQHETFTRISKAAFPAPSILLWLLSDGEMVNHVPFLLIWKLPEVRELAHFADPFCR